MDLLNIYERMILSDLRPNLSQYETKEGLENLKSQFYFFTLTNTPNPEVFVANLFDVIPSLKPGDNFDFDVDNQNNKISITLHPNPDEEELINIDLEPPLDDKAEVFYQIIEHEFLRLKKKLNAILVESTRLEDLNFLVLKFITKAKQLAREAHTFEKKLSASDTSTGKSSRYVIKILKKHLVYAILETQQIFSPVLKLELKSEYDLVNELFEHSASKIRAGAERLRLEMNKKKLDRLNSQFSSEATLSDKIHFFEGKVKNSLAFIASAKEVYGGDIDERDLYLEELGRLTAIHYTEQFAAKEATSPYKQMLEFLLKKETQLLSDKSSVEYRSLQKTDFFFRLTKQIELMRELVSVDPKAHAIGLLGDISTFAMLAQGRAWLKEENHFNDYLADLLRAKQYEVSDQTRNGVSGNQKGSGSLDITIRDSSKNGIIVSIVESFILESCGPENKIVRLHLRKLIELYDAAGNIENFAVVLARSSDFDKLWAKYKLHLDQVVFEGKLRTLDVELDWLTFDKVKIGVTELKSGEHPKRLFHVFINMYKPARATPWASGE